jgi:hypothetical protein
MRHTSRISTYAAGSSFTLKFRGEETQPIGADDTEATLKAKLEALTSIGVVSVVNGGGFDGDGICHKCPGVGIEITPFYFLSF